jgi:hypothetical protein
MLLPPNRKPILRPGAFSSNLSFQEKSLPNKQHYLLFQPSACFSEETDRVYLSKRSFGRRSCSVEKGRRKENFLANKINAVSIEGENPIMESGKLMKQNPKQIKKEANNKKKTFLGDGNVEDEEKGSFAPSVNITLNSTLSRENRKGNAEESADIISNLLDEKENFV